MSHRRIGLVAPRIGSQPVERVIRVFAPCVRLEVIGETTEAIGVAKMSTFSGTADNLDVCM